jgi:hypothetical protein
MTSRHTQTITDNGAMMGLLAGWQWRYRRYMLGVEGNVTFSDFQLGHQFAYTDEINFNAEYVGTALYKRGNIYQVTGRFGYFVTPFFMPYLRLGGQVSRDTVSYQVTGVVLSAPFVVTDFSSTKKDVWGAVGGIGAEFPTYIGSSTIRFEYNFVQTDRVTIRDSALPIIGVNQYHYPRTHVGKVAFVWNFL